MKRVALFVGVDRYEDGNIRDLEYAGKDAGALANAFKTFLKFDTVRELQNPATEWDVLGKVKELKAGLGKGDLFFFYFAGHGVRREEDDEYRLVCAGHQYEYLAEGYAGLLVKLLKKELKGAWDRMLVIDACQNDLRKTRAAAAGATARDLALILEGGADDAAGGPAASGSQVVVTSCSEGESALEIDEEGHGLFTKALLDMVVEHVRDGRRLAAGDFQGEMARRMKALAATHRLHGMQTPKVHAPIDCGIVLMEGAAPDGVTGTPGGQETAGRGMAVETKQCAKCRRWRPVTAMFECGKCGKVYCIEHQDSGTWWCGDCAAAERERAAAERKAREEAEARERAEKAQREKEAKEEAERLYQKGEDAYHGRGVAQSFEEAAKWYRKAAELGDARWQFDLGWMYAIGRGVEQSDEEAVKWYRKAAEQGHALGEFNLGVMYDNGRGVEQSDAEAVRWYRKAAEQGHAQGQCNLGWMYESGRGVAQSDGEAAKWYRKAAEQGHEKAKAALERLGR